MPISYRIDPQRRIIYTTLHGEVTTEDVLGYRARLRAEGRFSADFGRLIDAREIMHDFTRADIRRFADLTRLEEPSPIGSRRAVVLASADKEMMAVFQAYTRGHPIDYRPFGSIAEAEDWLGSAPDPDTLSREANER